MTTSQTSNPYVVHWVTIGPLADGSEMKIRATSEIMANGATDLQTISAQSVTATGPETAWCWDRIPSPIPETFMNDNLTVPGTGGYWRATYNQTRWGALWGYGGTQNNANYNPVPWVRLDASIWNGSAYAAHAWVLYASDPYHWVQAF
jgi:hypothetical protein